ncbi:MAG: hypothetical protein FRX48_00238 [Lasallia pustulata]|uniref:Uncharacterized protein n=1 Tax=Lasallia pustulata TaxID=136370 RepID=A0A5M8Q2X1_9LECA|nr:MAG: hypothetical protein FRX48_00238 [Lasallia pustulata]
MATSNLQTENNNTVDDAPGGDDALDRDSPGRTAANIDKEIAQVLQEDGTSHDTTPLGDTPIPDNTGLVMNKRSVDKTLQICNVQPQIRAKELPLYYGKNIKEHQNWTLDARNTFLFSPDEFPREQDKMIYSMQYLAGEPKEIDPQVGQSSAHNIISNSLACAITTSIAIIFITNRITIIIITMSVFTVSLQFPSLSVMRTSYCAVNIPRLSDFSSAAAAGNGGNPPPPGKPVGLRAQCNKEGAGSESMGEFVVVATTTRKKKGNGVGKEPVRRSKRTRHLPLDDASNRGNSCPEWCRGDDNLPACMQQARRRGCAIWAQPNCTLSGGSHCGACVRAGADKCFVVQTPVCACYTSLCNPRRQCLAEPPASATPDSRSPGVVAPRAATYDGSSGVGTRSRPSTRPSPLRPSPATTGTLREPRSRSSTPEELVAAMVVLPESTAHALRLLNAHQSCRRHENIEFNERHRVEEMGSEALSDSEDGLGMAGEE